MPPPKRWPANRSPKTPAPPHQIETGGLWKRICSMDSGGTGFFFPRGTWAFQKTGAFSMVGGKVPGEKVPLFFGAWKRRQQESPRLPLSHGHCESCSQRASMFLTPFGGTPFGLPSFVALLHAFRAARTRSGRAKIPVCGAPKAKVRAMPPVRRARRFFKSLLHAPAGVPSFG